MVPINWIKGFRRIGWMASLLLTAFIVMAFYKSAGDAVTPLAQSFFPFNPMPLIRKQEISCKSIASLNIGQDGDLLAPTSNRLFATINKGTDSIAIRIESDHLIFLTKAAFDGGMAKGVPFPLIENNSEYLKAVDSSSDGNLSLESFILNKKNGLAIWNKIRPAGYFGKIKPTAPDSQTIYMQCM